MLIKKAIFLFVFVLGLGKVFSQDSLQVLQPVLPLQFTSVEAKVINRNVQLLWEVSSNEEAKSFEIERADNGNNFSKIGGKLSLGRTGNATYEFVDALPKKNIPLSYRIRIVAKDGSIVYSDSQKIKIGNEDFSCKLKQNPVRQTIELEITTPVDANINASVYTNYGQKVAGETATVSAGTNTLLISSQNLLPGIHRLVVESGSERKVISFVKE